MDRNRVWQLTCASAVWLLLHLGGCYAIWWCSVWRVDMAAWVIGGVLLALSWAGTDIGYRLVWTGKAGSAPQWLRYMLATGGALAVQAFPGTPPDTPLRWQHRWFVLISLSGFVVPMVLLGWQGLFAAGFVRFIGHRYGLPAIATAVRVALYRIGKRLNRRIPCPDVALLVVQCVRCCARLARPVTMTAA